MKSLNKLAAVARYINQHPLAGKHRLLAYSKLVKWQLGQFVDPGEKTVPFVDGTFLSVSKGMTGATGNIYLGIHDFFEMGFLLHFLQPHDTFADIGANIGSYSILASGVKAAKTIAFEPSAKTFSALQKNISINQLENKITAYNIALGAKVGKLYFTIALDTVNHVIPDYEVENAPSQAEVSVNMFDNIAKRHSVPVLIKIDVEGFETEVINGMENTLADAALKAIMIELNGSGGRYGYDENKIHQKLLSHNFLPYLYDPFKRTISPAEGYAQHNTLYMRDIDFVKKRVEAAEKIRIFKESF